MNQVIKKLPVPIVGLMLALAATGNLVQSYSEIYRNIFGGMAAIMLILFLTKLLIYPKEVKEELTNPVVASVFPTFSMGVMLLSTYIKPIASSLAFAMWISGLIVHGLLIINFTLKYMIKLNIKQVFPSWFIPYVGIVIASVTAPAFGLASIGRLLFWFGFLSYFLLLPIILIRVFKIRAIPEPAKPTLVIFAAPVALCLAGYMNSIPNKNMFLIGLLVVLSQFIYLMVLLNLPKLLRLNFYPSYSAFTFPLVISAISLKLTNGFLVNIGRPIMLLRYIVKFEEALAVLIVLYVLIRYIGFMQSKLVKVK